MKENKGKTKENKGNIKESIDCFFFSAQPRGFFQLRALVPYRRKIKEQKRKTKEMKGK